MDGICPHGFQVSDLFPFSTEFSTDCLFLSQQKTPGSNAVCPYGIMVNINFHILSFIA